MWRGRSRWGLLLVWFLPDVEPVEGMNELTLEKRSHESVPLANACTCWGIRLGQGHGHTMMFVAPNQLAAIGSLLGWKSPVPPFPKPHPRGTERHDLRPQGSAMWPVQKCHGAVCAQGPLPPDGLSPGTLNSKP